MPGRVRQGFLGELAYVALEAGAVTAKMFSRVQGRMLDIEGRLNDLTNSSVARNTGTASVAVRKNSGSVDVGSRRRLNFIEGSNVTLTVADDSASEEVDVTVAANTAGTVTSVSVATANGLAGSVATATTTPAITLSTTITGLLKGNGTAISAASAGTDYLTANQAITLSGEVTGGPAGTAITTAIDRATNFTWTGTHTFSLTSVHNGGVSLGTGVSNVGRFYSDVTDSSTARAFLFQPTNAITPTSGQKRSIFRVNDSAGNPAMVIWPDRRIEFLNEGGEAATNADAAIAVLGAQTNAMGIYFAPSSTSSNGVGLAGMDTTVTGAYFGVTPLGASTSTNVAGGIFVTSVSTSSANDRDHHGGIFCASRSTIGVDNLGRTWTFYGWRVIKPTLPAFNNTRGAVDNIYGGYIQAPTLGYANAVTNEYGIYIEEHTRASTIKNGIFLANATSGYKAIAIRDQDAWIGSDAAATLTIGGTNCEIITTNIGFYTATPVARATTAGAASTFAANTSGIADDTATWDSYTIGQVVKALRNVGILT